MKYLISFESNYFDLESEEENPINPIRGRSVGERLVNQLKKAGIEVTEVESEDWGWFVEATLQGEKYLIGFSAMLDESISNKPEIMIQLEKSGSFFRSLFGQNKVEEKDQLLALIKAILRHVSDISNLDVSKNG